MTHSAIEATTRSRWIEDYDRHIVDLAQTPEALVVFAGDSLTDRWRYDPTWTTRLAKYKPVNLGVGGDRTQHLLWRLQHHALVPAKVYNVLIGTNNLTFNTTQEILDGIRACRDEIRRQCPESIILLQKILPRQKLRSEPEYEQALEVNAGITELTDGDLTIEADFSYVFQVEGEQHLNYDHILPDNCHISEAGYEAWIKALEPLLDQLIKEST